MACRLLSPTRHQYGNVVLPCEDRSSEQIFYAAWVHRISTAIQRGTALMIHNIAQGNRTKSRRTKDVDVEPNAGEYSGDDDRDEALDESNSEIDFTEEPGGDSDGGDGHERKGARIHEPSMQLIKTTLPPWKGRVAENPREKN